MSSQSCYLWIYFFLTSLLIIVIFSAGVDVQHDMEELQQRFNILRPEILETLSKSSFNLHRIKLTTFSREIRL